MKFIRFVFCFSLLLQSFVTAAQKEDYYVFGMVKEVDTFKKIEDVEIVIIRDGQYYDKILVNKSGKYDVKLPLGHAYDILFNKNGYVSKKIQMNTQEIPKEDRKGGFESNVDMHLFLIREGFDTSILDAPIGIMHFNSSKNALEYDFAHTENIQKQIQAEFKRLDDLAKNMDKMKKEFEALVAKGDAKVTEVKYEEAITNYQKALSIFPKDEPAKAKLAKAEELWAAQNADKKKEQEYLKLIADGEDRMKNKNWQPAKEKFEAALLIKPNEKIPQDRLKEIEAALASMNKQEEFDKLVKAGDELFGQKKWEECISKYEAAKSLIPTDKHPPEQISKAKKALDDLMADESARKERETKYNEWFSQGEKNFKDKNYEVAKKNFEEAQRIWSEPREPQDRIDEINQILADLAAKADKDKVANDADAEKARIDAEFQALVDKANAEFEKEELQQARANYVAASDLKPNEKFPKSRITRIDEMLAELDKLDEASKKERERKEKEAADLLAANQSKEEKDRLAEEARLKKLADEEAERQRMAEEKRLKEEEALAAKNRKRDLMGADRSMEEEAERYYREAREDKEGAKNTKVQKQKTDNEEFLAARSETSSDIRNRSAKSANDSKDQIDIVYRDGNNLTAMNDEKSRREKEKSEKNQQHWREREGALVNENVKQAETEKENLEAVALRDLYRQNNSVDATNAVKEKNESNQTSWRTREGALTADEVYKADKAKSQNEKMAETRDELRLDRVSETEDLKTRMEDFQKDARAAEQEFINNEMDKNERLKKHNDDLLADKEGIRDANIKDTKTKKADADEFTASKQREFELIRAKAGNEVQKFNDGSSPKNEDDYILPEGGEKLNQGVNETSYRLPGEKMVIERSVRIGNKVDVYKKVISQTGIFYFKNDSSTSEVTWTRETIEAFE